jgi:act minimal PKS acyl carrier protein
MPAMTLDDLLRFLTESAGANDALDDPTDVADTEFEVLGYDSLAIMETTARIEQTFGVTVPDDQLGDLTTPGALLALVNGLLSEPA